MCMSMSIKCKYNNLRLGISYVQGVCTAGVDNNYNAIYHEILFKTRLVIIIIITIVMFWR